MKREPNRSPCIKPKYKWTTGLYIRQDSLEVLGEKQWVHVEEDVEDVEEDVEGKNFPNRTQTAQKIRPTTDKADLILKKRLHTQQRELSMGGV